MFIVTSDKPLGCVHPLVNQVRMYNAILLGK